METNGTVIWAYIFYLFLSIGMTVWVARTLHKNGRVFLIDAFHGNEKLADSVNHLLVVGFYLINIGYISLALRYGHDSNGTSPWTSFFLGEAPKNVADAFEAVSTKVGFVLVVLGAMHFFNLYLFSKMRRRAILRNAPPPITPNEFLPREAPHAQRS